MNTEETPKGNRIGSVLGPRLLPGHTELSKKPLSLKLYVLNFLRPLRLFLHMTGLVNPMSDVPRLFASLYLVEYRFSTPKQRKLPRNKLLMR